MRDMYTRERYIIFTEGSVKKYGKGGRSHREDETEINEGSLTNYVISGDLNTRKG